MSDVRCDFSDLLVDQCAHCTGRDGGEAAEKKRLAALLDRPDVFPALYAGTCFGCGLQFEAGEPIRLKHRPSFASGGSWLGVLLHRGPVVTPEPRTPADPLDNPVLQRDMARDLACALEAENALLLDQRAAALALHDTNEGGRYCRTCGVLMPCQTRLALTDGGSE